MTDVRWLEHLVPDYLWAAGVVAGDGDEGLFTLARIHDAINSVIPAGGPSPDGVFDGGLVSLERLSGSERDRVRSILTARGLVDVAVSAGFAHALRMYPSAPGNWLANLVALPGDHVDPLEAEKYLNRAIAAIADGRGHGATAIKATVFRQMLASRALSFAPDAFPMEELGRYPKDVTPSERRLVEASIRASYLATAALDDAQNAARIAWARRFWDANWNLYACRAAVLEDDEAAGKDNALERGGTAAVAGDEADDRSQSGERVTALWDDFLRTALQTDPHLYDPGRHEVLSGLASHGFRLAFAVAAHPGLWIGEFSGPLLRSMAEVIIYLAWFATPEGREPAAHVRFKEYGRGHLKLLKLHAEEFADRAGSSEMLDDFLEDLEEEVNLELGEEWQDISFEGTFSGRDLRKMAIAADVTWLYKLVVGPASSVLHSEWPVLTRYAMELCVNPVHRPHWLPRRDLKPALRPVAGVSAAVLAGYLLDAYKAALVLPSGEAPRADASPAEEPPD